MSSPLCCGGLGWRANGVNGGMRAASPTVEHFRRAASRRCRSEYESGKPVALMLYQELPRIESTRLDGWNRWLVPAVIVGVAFTAALLLVLIGQAYFAAAAMLI